MFRKGELIELSISDFAFGGKGIGRISTEKGDFTVFVQNALPGQHVRARVVKCKSRFAECKLDEVLTPSEDEVSIPFQRIPGAPYASLPIEKQLELKEKTAKDLYARIGEVDNLDTVYQGITGSPETWHYRNKMEYSFSAIGFDLEKMEEYDGFAMGFKHRGTWWIVENLDQDSGLFDEEVESKLHHLRKWMESTGLPAWHPPKREGFFRFLVIRKSFSSGKILINLVTTSDDLDQFDLNEFITECQAQYGDRIQGILHTINDDKGERVEARSGSSKVVFGEEKIIENVNGLDFAISMSSFFQTNPRSAEKLYQKAVELAGTPNEGDVLMDLFCGTGTIAQLLAKGSGAKVIGVDIVESAIEDARENAAMNGVENIDFYAADVGKFLLEYPEYQGKIGTIVLDPPRAGISPKTLRKVIRLEAPKLVYVSCNPATQARDTQVLREAGYELKHLEFVDQFPHTAHVEAIAVYEKASAE